MVWFACCDAQQTATLIAIVCYVVVDLATWRLDRVAKPFKLLAVFVHEASHASACVLTGGSVKSLEVNLNEGGVTRFTGGIGCIVTPAGYIGGALWGAVGYVCCGSRIGSYCLAALLGLALLATLAGVLCGNRRENAFTTAAVCGGFLGILICLVCLEIYVAKHALRYGLLFLVTYVSLFSVADIYDDCVARYVKSGAEMSDAVVCERICPLLPARGWGALWFFASLALWFLGVCVCLELIRREN